MNEHEHMLRLARMNADLWRSDKRNITAARMTLLLYAKAMESGSESVGLENDRFQDEVGAQGLTAKTLKAYEYELGKHNRPKHKCSSFLEYIRLREGSAPTYLVMARAKIFSRFFGLLSVHFSYNNGIEANWHALNWGERVEYAISIFETHLSPIENEFKDANWSARVIANRILVLWRNENREHPTQIWRTNNVINPCNEISGGIVEYVY